MSAHSQSITLTTPTRTIAADGVSYAYRRFGAEFGVPLLCLQHFTGTLDCWDPAVFDALSKERTIILFENAGVARSGGVTPDAVAGMAEHVAVFLNALAITQVDVLGFSLGGFIAQYLAIHQPTRIRRLILSRTGPEGGRGTSMNRPELLRIFSDQQMAISEKLKILFFPDDEQAQTAAMAYLGRIGARDFDNDTATTSEVATKQLQAMAKWETETSSQFSTLKNIPHPVLVTNGNNDIMIPTFNSFTLCEHIPDSTLIIYAKSGHGSLYQYAQTFAAHVQEFLGRR